VCAVGWGRRERASAWVIVCHEHLRTFANIPTLTMVERAEVRLRWLQQFRHGVGGCVRLLMGCPAGRSSTAAAWAPAGRTRVVSSAAFGFDGGAAAAVSAWRRWLRAAAHGLQPGLQRDAAPRLQSGLQRDARGSLGERAAQKERAALGAELGLQGSEQFRTRAPGERAAQKERAALGTEERAAQGAHS